MPRSSVEDALARVVATLPGVGEERPGQLAMAHAVEDAMETGRHLVVQAGTGTGKSLAYLVPAVLSGRKVVVATATKALQDQLAGKDLPQLAAALGVPVEFAVLKGRSNYFCVQRARELAGGDDQLDLDDSVGEFGREIARVLEWAAATATGDRAELPFEPRPRAWSRLSVTAMDCPGASRCPSGEDCFAEKARRRAEEAQVVVVNTHLYGAHLASEGQVLPEHDVVVFDEAHAVEDVISASLGLELGAGRFRALARTARPVVEPADQGTLDDLDGAGLRLENLLAPRRGTRLPPGLGDELAGVVQLAVDRINKVLTGLRKVEGDDARRTRSLQAAGHLVADLGFAVEAGDGWVTWVEGPDHMPVLRVAPVDVGELLAERLWGDVTAVLTSATVPPGLAGRLGLPDDGYSALDVGSPFPYEEHALLYCAAHLPDPRSPSYERAMHEELEALLRLAGGRTLALFTSWRAMHAAADALRDKVPWPLLTQADLPKPALVEAFSSDEHACLFATMGFWQGIDVPGPALSQVVIDRIPFPRPDEPLLQARRERAGPAAFRVIDLARAATMLAQGAGRLIRSASDRGVVAVLDPRLATAGYKWDLVRALPPMRRTRDRADVEAFLTAALPST